VTIAPTLICGSVAYDTIMVFEGRFRQQILADQIHILNVAFLVPEMRREFGGCAGNIAYNLRLLEGAPLIMATVGHDATPYLERLASLELDTRCVRTVPGSFTAQAFITTDLDDNQITAFHPGAMNHSEANHVIDAGAIELGIVAPDGRAGMLQHAREFAALGIPFVFDPGQGLPMFDRSELEHFVDLANVVAVNDYEGKLLAERTGRDAQAMAKDGKVVIVTMGAKGSVIYMPGRTIAISAAAARAVADPTGCGDAYRAGILYGMATGMDWETTGRLASVLGAIKVAHRGPQNHHPSRDEIAVRYFEAYGYRPW